MTIMLTNVMNNTSPDVIYNIISMDDNSDQSDIFSVDSQSEDLSGNERTPVRLLYEGYICEWEEVKKCDLFRLNEKAMKGHLANSRFRSVFWRLFFKLLNFPSSVWVEWIKEYRQEFKQLYADLVRTPWDNTSSNSEGGIHIIDDPLSQKETSCWQQYFCDEELRSLIKQDVIRTFPGIQFFRSQEIQSSMITILFLYAKAHPHLCYRQGMHEILAPILFVLHKDHTAFKEVLAIDKLPDDLMEMFNPDEIESDAFSIFQRVMTYLESSYYVSLNSSAQCNGEKEKNEFEVVHRLEWIREKLLRFADPELADHLSQLDIPLQLFGIRWLRLLFGREFPLDDLLMLWDAIFSTEDLCIVNYIVTAMLVAVRHLLIGQDNTSCLSLLMKYPAGVNVGYVIQLAQHLAQPTQFPLPSLPPLQPPKKRHMFKRFASSGSSKSENSLRWLPVKSFAVGHVERDSAIEGYTLQDPRLLRAEVESLRTVISVVQIKISQYHMALHDAVFQSNDPESIQAWEGLDELCCLLKGVTTSSVNEVEHADEAGEEKFETKEEKRETIVKNEKPLKEAIANKHRPEMTVFKQTLGSDEPIKGAPMADPLRRSDVYASEDDWRHFPKDFNRLSILK